MKTLIVKSLGLTLIPVGLSLAIVAASPAAAAPKKKPAAKTAPAKKPARQARLIREVLGTEQLLGYEGNLGETFTLGKEMPLNFTLNKAEYSVGRVNIGDNTYFPKGDEKMLVLHYTVQNPMKRPINYSYSYLTFKAVDASGVTRDYVGGIARPVTGESLHLSLNPGQKVDAYTAIKVAAYGAVPKLIVGHYYEAKMPIVRYDLRKRVTKLAAPFADPADAAGVTAQKMVPATAGTFYPTTDLFDARLDSVSYSTAPLANRELDKGKRYVFATFTLKNKARTAKRYGQSYFRADLKDADGEKINYNTSILKASRDEESSGELLPGEEARVRFYWMLPTNVNAKTVLLQYGYDRESRTYAFDVEGIAK